MLEAKIASKIFVMIQKSIQQKQSALKKMK